MALGGRVAEEIFFGQVSTGAQNDLERITRMAYGMVTLYGMNDRIGLVSFNDKTGEYQFQKPYSDETAKMIDEEVRKVIEDARNRTRQIIHEHREQLESIALELLDKEVIYTKDVERLIGKRPFAKTAEHEDVALLPETPAAELPNSEEPSTPASENNETENGSSTEDPKNDE
jgi:cell division protease FtsH